MNKHYYKRIGLIVSGLIILISHATPFQNREVVQVSVDVNGKSLDFSKGVELFFYVEGREIKPLLFLNGFVVPDFGNEDVVDVCFRYQKHIYCINKLSTSKFSGEWSFGVDKKPFSEENKSLLPIEKGAKTIYYIRFTPKGGGVGTIVVVTKK